MSDTKNTREEFINNTLYKFRGGMAREFYFTNKDVPFIPYYYDPEDDSLHADAVSVPFHFEEKEITNGLIFDSLCALETLLMQYYINEKGITLYLYD